MASSSSLLAYEMRDAIYAKFQSEMHAGGKLANLVYLSKSVQPITSKMKTPSDVIGGVAMRGTVKSVPYGQRQRIATQEFRIWLAARSQRTSLAIANLDDALEALRPVIDDANGGGVIGMLNNPSLFAIPSSGQNLAMESLIGEPVFSEDVEGEGAEQSVWAYWHVPYHADGKYTF